MQCVAGGRQRWGSGLIWLDPYGRRLVLRTSNVTSLVRKELDLVQQVEQYQLDIVGVSSTHSSGSGTKLLERGWTVLF